jgi:cytochrome c-type biogenesis protein CcmF
MAIIGYYFFQTEGQGNLKVGESLTVANYTFTYRGLTPEQGPNYVEDVATMDIQRNGRATGQMFPKRVVYNKQPDQPITEVGLRPGPVEDVYVVLAGFDDTGQAASFKIFVNPMMSWMWVGGLVMIFGTLLALWPRRTAAPVEARVRVPSGAQPAGGN